MAPAVNSPTNVKQKEADVNQKLQLYGIYSGFASGKLPSNKQIDIALNSALASKPLATPSTKLSEEGRVLVKDVRDVIEQAKFLLLTKNEGNLLQDFVYQSQHIGTAGAQVPGAPVDKETAQQHGNQALEGLRTLGTLLLSNGQFRKLLNDATVLLRDIAGDGASNAATRIKPSEEALSKIDHPAEDNTWHDVPDLSTSALKSQAQAQYNKVKPVKDQLQQQAESGANTAQDPNADPQATAQATGGDLVATAKDNVPEEHKQKLRDLQSRTKDYVGEKVPKERRDQTIYRLKKMIVEVQSHSDYQEAIETLLSLAEQYTGHGKSLASQGQGTVKSAHTDTALTTVETDLRTLLERFANSTSADDVVDAINQLYRDAERDPELKNWFKSVDAYIRKALKQTGFIMQDAATEEWNQLQDKGTFLLRERYRDHTNRVLDEFKFFGLQFDEDPQNKQFAASLQKLFNDLGNDENGKPTFKPHLLKDLSQVIVPAALENIRYVPIPRIEYTDPQVDAIIENLVIESDNLAPNSLEIGSDNNFKWGRKGEVSSNKNKVLISVSGVQMDLRDVSYYIKRKQGFPSITDTGVMDIFMGGSGFSFKIALETADTKDKTKAHFFKINTVKVDIKNLTIKLKQSKHKLLFNVFRPLMFAILRPAIGKVLEKLIKDQTTVLDGKAYEIHQEAERALTAARNDPENAPNLYKRYVDAAQKTLTQKKKQAEEAAADKKANVAVTQHDSIFPQVKLPGGISSKATEYKSLAAKGDKWESPVFGIGSAAESTNLPKLAPVTRKPHSAAQGGVRGPNNIPSTTSSSQPGVASSTEYGSTGTPAAGYGTAVQNPAAGFGNEVTQAFASPPSTEYQLKNTAVAPNGALST